MNKIISKEHFSEKVFKLVIEAPLIAKSRKAGHFVIVRVGEKGERMPLTIAAADPKAKLRNSSMCRRWRRCSSDATHRTGPEGSRKPCDHRTGRT